MAVLPSLRGHHVILWPDADKAGAEHMRKVAERVSSPAYTMIVEWPTGVPAPISPAWLNFRDAVMERRLTHDGDPRVARHIQNMVIKSDRLGPRPVRDRNAPRSFIDAGIAAVLAHDRASQSEPTSVYETRGIDFI